MACVDFIVSQQFTNGILIAMKLTAPPCHFCLPTQRVPE